MKAAMKAGSTHSPSRFLQRRFLQPGSLLLTVLLSLGLASCLGGNQTAEAERNWDEVFTVSDLEDGRRMLTSTPVMNPKTFT